MAKPLILVTNDDGINAPGIRTLINVIGLPIIVSTILIGDLLFILFAGLIILLGTKEYIDLLKKHSIIASSTLLYLFQFLHIVWQLP